MGKFEAKCAYTNAPGYIELITTHTIMVHHSFASSSASCLPPLLLLASLLYQGFLDQSLMCVACQRLDKQVLGCSEQLMQALEQMDGIVSCTCMNVDVLMRVCVCVCVCVCVFMQVLGASETLVRGRRKALVARTQNLLHQSDQLHNRAQKCQKTQK